MTRWINPLIVVGVVSLLALGACDSRSNAPGDAPSDASGNRANELTGNDPASEAPPPQTGNAAPDAATTAPPPPPPGAFVAQITPSQTAELKQLGVEVAVPTAVPPEFQAIILKTEQKPGEPGGGPAYTLVYRDLVNHCFAIEFTTGGIGSTPETDYRTAIAPPGFPGQDYGLNFGPYKDAKLRQSSPGSQLSSDWIQGKSGFYRLVGASTIHQTFPDQGDCQDIAPDAAVAIVESLAYLTDDIIGDG